MSDTEPTRAFPRFPWPQLVFCVACLSMTGWTWMRYSYCWRMTSEEAFELVSTFMERRWPMGAYVELDYRKPEVPPELPKLSIEFTGFPSEPDHRVRRGRWLPGAMVLIGEDRVVAAMVTFEASSRLHGASVAGLVVGAMGCFIFGLYLRRWLRARRSPA